MSNKQTTCQLISNESIGYEPALSLLWRKIRSIKRHLAIRSRLKQFFARILGRASDDSETYIDNTASVLSFCEGQLITVRSIDEILATLDNTRRCGGCAFLPGMEQFCGKTFTIKKVVRSFFDERRWRMLKCRNTVILDEVYCDGSGNHDTQGCDRMCFYFWRTEWLEKNDNTN
jgi:hypothetical protein